MRVGLGKALALGVLTATQGAWAGEVAAVMLLQGEVTVVDDAGGVRPAVLGEGLTTLDTVSTGDNAAVVLHLHNNHLVRIDEDLDLQVADIVLLKAPEIDLDANTQLATLLYTDERATIQGLDEAERLAGWHARLSAGFTPPSTLEEANEPTQYDFESDEIEGELLRAGGIYVGESQPRPQEISSSASKDKKKPKKPRKPKKPKGGAAPLPADVAPPPPVPDPYEQNFEALKRQFADPGALRTCIEGWATGLPVEVHDFVFELRFNGDGIERVLVDQGLTAPTCAPDLLAVDGDIDLEPMFFSVHVE